MNHYEITAPSFTFSGGATALNATGAAAPTFMNGYADFLLGLPITRNTALQNPLLTEDGGGSNEQSATLRSWEYGLYIRDQFQLTRNLTVSAGVRWEYYPVPQHVDRGIEVFDFTTNRLLMCGLGSNPIDCGIKVQKDLFTPRLGVAYRAGESLVFRAGYSRNPQNDNMIGTRMRNFPVNVQINDVAVGGNNFTPVGSFSDGYNAAADSQPQPAAARGAGRREHHDQRSRQLHARRHHNLQRHGPESAALQPDGAGRVRREPPERHGAEPEPQLQPDRRRQREPAVQSARPRRWIPDDGAGEHRSSARPRQVRRAAGEPESPDDEWASRMTGAYTYAHATDWWAGGILIPEYWGLNKGTQGGNTPHKVDISATYELPFGEGRKYASNGGVDQHDPERLAGQLLLHRVLGLAVHRDLGGNASLNANSPQVADQVKSEVENHARNRRATISWFDPTAFRPVTEARFGTAGFNTHAWTELREPRPERVPHVPVEAARRTVQFRLEIFNLTNSPHFANPSGTHMSNVSYNPDGSIRAPQRIRLDYGHQQRRSRV